MMPHGLEGWLKDLKHSALVLLRRPAFAIMAVSTLGLGIGATVAIFSVMYGVLLKPLPFSEPDRLVAVWHRAPGINVPKLQQGAATYFTYRESGRAFEDIALWDTAPVTITDRGEPERVQALRVTHGLLPLLRVSPELGRGLSAEEHAPGSPLRVLVTHGYWQRRFGGVRAVGQTLTVNGRRAEVIGVLPDSFSFLGTNPAIVVPFQFDRATVLLGTFGFQAIARLKPGVTIEAANADIARMIPLALERFPLPPGATPKMFRELRLGPNVRPLAADVIGNVERMLWILFATVGLVLLIACFNVANLFLVRGEARQQEFAVRTSLGATQARLARQLLSECVVIALAGGVLGVLIASMGVGVLVRMAPAGLPRLNEIGITGEVLGFTLLVSIGAGLLLGLFPALRFTRPHVAALKEGGRGASDAPGRHRTRNALVVLEVALALVLLIVCGLMIRTFVALRGVEPGFQRPQEVQTFRLAIPEALIKDPQQVARTYREIAQQLRRVPGVKAASLSSSVTMDLNQTNGPIFVEDFPAVAGGAPPLRRWKRVAPDFFTTMGNPLVAGRDITWTDVQKSRPVAIISENLARELWKDPAAAIGKRIREAPKNPWREIVGVSGNERDDGLNRPSTPLVYFPILQTEFLNEPVSVTRNVAYVIRSERVGSPGFMREVQQAVWSVSPTLPLANPRTLAQIRDVSMAQTSFALVMMAAAAAIALLLAIVGIYGVVAYIAAQRTREIGIRMALGAQAGDVRRLFLRHGVRLTMTGIVGGIAAAVLFTELMSSLLFGVSTMDLTTYAAVSATVAAVALLAAYVPARRASSLDPIAALRTDV